MVCGKAISKDLFSIIINLSKSGNSYGQIAKQVQLLRYTICNIVKLYKTRGSIAEKTNLGKWFAITSIDLRALRRIKTK